MPYSGNPSASPTDEIRFLIQDTDPASPILTDGEIQYYIDKMTVVNGSTFKTAANLAEVIAAKYAGQVAISSDQTSIQMEQLQTKYEELAMRLRAQAVEMDASGNGPITGGSNWDDWWYGQSSRKVFKMRSGDNMRAGSQHNSCDSPWIEYEYGGWWEGQ